MMNFATKIQHFKRKALLWLMYPTSEYVYDIIDKTTHTRLTIGRILHFIDKKALPNIRSEFYKEYKNHFVKVLKNIV